MCDMGELWERNKQFITRVAAGAAVFLILAYIVLGIGSESDAERKRRVNLKTKYANLQKQKNSQGGLIEGSTDELFQQLTKRVDELCVGVPRDLEKETRLSIRFVADRQKFCRDLQSMASEAAVIMKPNLQAVDFHERETDGVPEYTEHWAALESFKRLLQAVIRSGFFEIQSVVCDPVERTVIQDDPDWSLARYGVSVEVCGTIDSFLKLYTLVHEPRRFVSVCVGKIRRESDEAPERLEGVITAWGLRIEKTEDKRKKETSQSIIRHKR